MTTPQTFYAVLAEEGAVLLLDETNANKAEAVALNEATMFPDGGAVRVIAYTVIATFGGDDE